MVFQLFGDREDCAQPLPVRPITTQLLFNEVMVFEQLIEPSEFFAPGDEQLVNVLGPQVMMPATHVMGLPLALVNPAWAAITRPRSVHRSSGAHLTSGMDKAFLLTGNQRSPRLDHDTARVREISAASVKPGAVAVGDTSVMLSARSSDRLLRGEDSFARSEDGRLVAVRARFDEVVVDDPQRVLVEGRLDRDGQTANVRCIYPTNHGFLLHFDQLHPVRLVSSSSRPATDRKGARAPTRQPPDPVMGALMSQATTPAEWFAWWTANNFGGNECAAARAVLSDCRAGELQQGAGPCKDAVGGAPALYFMYLSAVVESGLVEHCGLDGQRAPTPALPTFRIGLLTRYEQRWELLGYSRGSLLHSVTLAPQESVEVEVFTWDRFKLEHEQSFGAEYERNQEINNLSRTSAVIGREMQQTLGTQTGVNGGVSFPVKAVNVDLGGSASVSANIDQGIDSKVEQIAEATVTTSERYKATHQVKIVETRDTGTETRATRRFHNPNGSRTLALHHFEVQEHHRVTTAVRDRNRYVVLVDNPELGNIDLEFVLAHEDRLQQALLSPNFQGGFAAARIIAAQRWAEEEELAEAQHRAEQYAAQARAAAASVSADSGASGAGAPPASGHEHLPNRGIYALARNIENVLGMFLELEPISDMADEILSLMDPYRLGPSVSRVTEIDVALSRHAFWLRLISAYPGFSNAANTFVEALRAARDNPSSGTQDEVITALGRLVVGLDDDWLSALKQVAVASIVTYAVAVGSRSNLHQYLTSTNILLATYLWKTMIFQEDMGLQALLSRARKDVAMHQDLQSVMELAPAPPGGAEPSEIATVAALAPVQPPPKVHTRAEVAAAQAALKQLLLHLNENRTYYANELWRQEDPNTRFERLTSIGVGAFVENRLLGFAGSQPMYPLRLEALPDDVRAKLEATFTASANHKTTSWQEEVTLPTDGLHLEASLGSCDAIEPYLLRRRELDLAVREAEAGRAAAARRQAELEADRMTARLEADPPQLGPPSVSPAPVLASQGAPDPVVDKI
jgi:hypothetical protein